MKKKPINICNNDELCKLDMASATPEQTRAWLMIIIENELRKGAECDETLLLECTEQLEMLADKGTLSAAEARVHLAKLLVTNQQLESTSIALKHRFHRPVFRFTTVAALIVMFSAIFSHIYVYAQIQHDNELYQHAVIEYQTEPSHDLSEISPKQLTHTEHEAVYTDLTAFLRDYQHLDFYFPHHLRNGAEIRSIRVTYQSPKSWIVVFTFADNNISHFAVQCLSQPEYSIQQPQSEKELPVGDQTYAIFSTEADGETVYRAEAVTDGIRYTAEARHYDTLCYLLFNTVPANHSYFDMDEFLTDFPYFREIPLLHLSGNQFDLHLIILRYVTTQNWTLNIRFDMPGNHFENQLHISPLNNDDIPAFKDGTLMLSNETASVYLLSHGATDEFGHYQAVCVTNDTCYTVNIYGYEQFITVIETLFGPFS